MLRGKTKMINLMELRSTYGSGGGPDKTILLSAKKHNVDKVKVVMVYLRGERDIDFEIGNRAKSMGLELIEIPEKGRFDFRSIKTILRLIEEYQIDILHGHDYRADVFGLLVSMANRKIRLITTAHGWIDIGIKPRFYNWLDIQAMRYYDKVIAVCNETKTRLIKMGVNEEKIKVIYNSIDVEQWKPDEKDRSSIKMELLIPDDSTVIGIIGRLSKEKDLITLLNSAVKVIKEVPQARFLIVGEGPEKENLIQYAKVLGIESSVIFAGHRGDVLDIYQTIDLLAITSQTEGLCNSILEAQAMAKPVIATNVGGNSEIIQDKLNGLLFPYQDVEGIAQGMIDLLKNREISKQMGEAGRRVICEKFSFDMRLKKVEELYMELMEKDV